MIGGGETYLADQRYCLVWKSGESEEYLYLR